SCAHRRLAARAYKTNARRVYMTTSHCNVRLEVHFGYKLEVARIAGAGNGAECRASEASVGIIQRRRVRHIEGFRAEFEVHPLGNTKGLPDHQIRLLKPRSANRI